MQESYDLVAQSSMKELPTSQQSLYSIIYSYSSSPPFWLCCTFTCSSCAMARLSASSISLLVQGILHLLEYIASWMRWGSWPCLRMSPRRQMPNFGILEARSAMQSALKWRQQARLTSRKESERRRSLMQERLKDFWPVRMPGLVFLSGWQKLASGTPMACEATPKWWWQKELILLLLFLLFPKNCFSANLKARLKNSFCNSSGLFFVLWLRVFTFSRAILSCSLSCCSSMSLSSSLLSNLLSRMSMLGCCQWVLRRGSISSGMLPEGVGKLISEKSSPSIKIKL